MSAPGGIAPSPLSLGPREAVPGRPFTSVDLTQRDVTILYEVLGDVRSVLHEVDVGIRSISPYERLTWMVDGLTHRLLICDEPRLRSHPSLCVVGFFGERRTELDSTPLEKANDAIIAEFTKYPGILSYSSMELPGGHWANLVLHDDPIDTQFWRKSELHARAARLLSPVHYLNVRIHNAQLTAGLFQQPVIVVKRTKYYDFSGDGEWRAERILAP